jgi:hypothetical protein
MRWTRQTRQTQTRQVTGCKNTASLKIRDGKILDDFVNFSDTTVHFWDTIHAEGWHCFESGCNS